MSELSADTLTDILQGRAKSAPVDDGPPPGSANAALPVGSQDASESSQGGEGAEDPAQGSVAQPALPAAVQRAIEEAAGISPPLRAFGSGTPAPHQTTTEAILGKRVEARVVDQPLGRLVDVPTSGRPSTSGTNPKITADPLGDDRAAAERDMKRSRGKAAAEAALRDLCKEYPTTKLINIRIYWRDPKTGEYRYKGRRKNVSMNEIRDPTDVIGNRGENWLVSFQPADQGLAWDDPKTWRQFEFDRDGPMPPREWTIETPEEDDLVVEVEGMGSIGLKDLKDLMDSWNKPAQAQAAQVAPQVQPQYMLPPRDHRAEERENELRKVVEETRRQNEQLMQRMAEKEREAERAQHRAEVETQKAGFMSILESMKSKMDAMEFKLNQPPPPPPPPPPQAPHTDITTALLTIAPHIKDIFTVNKESETEKYRMRELELQKERDRMEREARERHDLFQRELDRQREETKNTLEMYRMMGEQSKESSRAIAEFVQKQQDPSGTMSVLKMATDQSVQQMQLFATLVKSGLMGGGGGQNPNIDWGDLVGRGFEMLGNIGAAFADSSAAKAKAAAQIAASQSQQLPAQASPPMSGMAPQAPVRIPRAPAPARAEAAPAPEEGAAPEQPNEEPASQKPDDPLAPFIADVNHSVLVRDDPKRVADKIATVVRMAINFGEGKQKLSGPLRLLMEDPKKFLLQAYTTKKYAGTPEEYLMEIADILLATFGPDEVEDEDDDDAEEAATPPPGAAVPVVAAPVAASEPEVTVSKPGSNTATTSTSAKPPGNGGTEPTRRGRRPRVVQQPLPSVEVAPVAPAPPEKIVTDGAAAPPAVTTGNES